MISSDKSLLIFFTQTLYGKRVIFLSSSEYTMTEAIQEAKRCLNCARPLCRTGCPIENEIPSFIHALSEGNLGQAYNIITTRSNLPAVCGRVCPHEKQCEAHCILAKKGQAIRIGELERCVADFAEDTSLIQPKPASGASGKVAVIGSGPAGLTVAGDLARQDFAVTVFESQPEPGGILLFGIPQFRLDKHVVRREIDKMSKLGVVFQTSTLVGPDVTVDQLFEQGYDAIFIGTGTALPRMLDLPGKDLPGVLPATYLLSTVILSTDEHLSNEEVPVHAGDNVIVIGAGNVAMDAARTAIRLKAASVTVVYRRGEADITALRSEYEDAVAEGVQFRFYLSPVAYEGTAAVTGLKTEILELDEDDKLIETGRFETLPANCIITAVGQRPAARIVSTTHGIDVDKSGFVITRSRPYGMTTRPGVFAGGDVVHGPATVVLAMKEAKKVAEGIAQYIDAKNLLSDC